MIQLLVMVCLLCVLATVGCSGSTAAAPAGDVYVSPAGNDAWSGRLAAPNEDRTDGPLATVAAARDKVRALRATAPDRTTAVTVLLRGGRYELDEMLQFGPEDSGTNASPTVYAAFPGERPVLSGGRVLGGWTVDQNGWWTTTVEDAKDGRWVFRQLWADGQRRGRTRLPENGVHRIAGTVEPSATARGKGYDRFAFADKQIDPAWQNLTDVEVITFHTWVTSRLQIASVGENIVSFKQHTGYSSWWINLQQGRRFLCVNVREALGQSGRWYLDRPTGKLTYVPLAGETPDKTQIIAPRLAQLVRITADFKNHRWVEHLVFRGLTFEHASMQFPQTGRPYTQAQIYFPAAVIAEGLRSGGFEGCTVQHVGEYALELGVGCKDSRVVDCELLDTGGGALKIGTRAPKISAGGMEVELTDESAASNILVRNNLLARGGRMHPGAIGLWVAHSHHNTIQHNEITDYYYSGVTLGWVWTYDPSFAHHNDFSYNHVHHCGQGMLNDQGGVYTLGIQPGTVIHHNRIHDIRAYRHSSAGIYTDQATTGLLVENNLIYHNSQGGYRHHFGKDITVRNNILADGVQYQIHRELPETYRNFHFTQNIVWYRSGYLLDSDQSLDPEKARLDMDHNLYWNASGPVLFPPTEAQDARPRTLEQWRKDTGREEGSIVADPLFVDPDTGDYRLKPGSPAERIGFVPFDVSTAGRLEGFRKYKDLPPVAPAWTTDGPR